MNITSDTTLSNKSVTAILDTREQNLEGVRTVVEQILRMAGCAACGRLSILNLHLSDELAPEQKEAGVVSLVKHGF